MHDCLLHRIDVTSGSSFMDHSGIIFATLQHIEQPPPVMHCHRSSTSLARYRLHHCLRHFAVPKTASLYSLPPRLDKSLLR